MLDIDETALLPSEAHTNARSRSLSREATLLYSSHVILLRFTTATYNILLYFGSILVADLAKVNSKTEREKERGIRAKCGEAAASNSPSAERFVFPRRLEPLDSACLRQ